MDDQPCVLYTPKKFEPPEIAWALFDKVCTAGLIANADQLQDTIESVKKAHKRLFRRATRKAWLLHLQGSY